MLWRLPRTSALAEEQSLSSIFSALFSLLCKLHNFESCVKYLKTRSDISPHLFFSGILLRA